MEIKNKFNIGDFVYYIDYDCSGQEYNPILIREAIDSIRVYATEDGEIFIRYIMNDSYIDRDKTNVSEDDMFLSLDDALDALKEIVKDRPVYAINLSERPPHPNAKIIFPDKSSYQAVFSCNSNWIVEGNTARANPDCFAIKSRWYDKITKLFGIKIEPRYVFKGLNNNLNNSN